MGPKLLICRGNAPIGGRNITPISYGPFSGIPSVTATVIDSKKNGSTVCIRKRTPTSAKLYTFYNGGLMLINEGSVDWIAIGPTDEVAVCSACPVCPPHVCDTWRVFT